MARDADILLMVSVVFSTVGLVSNNLNRTKQTAKPVISKVEDGVDIRKTVTENHNVPFNTIRMGRWKYKKHKNENLTVFSTNCWIEKQNPKS